MNNLKFSEFTDEFDIAKHFPFSQVFGFLFIFRCLRAHAVLILLRDWVSKMTKILCYIPTRRYLAKCIHYRYNYFAYLFSNSSLHLLSRSLLNVLVFSEISASKFGAFSSSRLHNCAYIDEYFGSSRAFSNI